MFNAEEMKRIMNNALENYDIGSLESDIETNITIAANRGCDKIYYFFDDSVPDNVRKEIVNWANGLGFEANLPVADKSKIRISWR